MMETIADLSRLIQDDLLCVLDDCGLDNKKLVMVCQIVVDRTDEFAEKYPEMLY